MTPHRRPGGKSISVWYNREKLEDLIYLHAGDAQMTTTTKQNSEPIRLDFKSRQTVLVTDENEDRWLTTVNEAAQACRAARNQVDWQEEFEQFLAHIHDWAARHKDRVAEAYVGIGSEGLTGIIVTKDAEPDLSFDDEVTRLDIELSRKFANCPADILRAPGADAPESRVPYLPLERTLKVYGDQG